MLPDIAQMAFDAAMLKKAWRESRRHITGLGASSDLGSPDPVASTDLLSPGAAASPADSSESGNSQT